MRRLLLSTVAVLAALAGSAQAAGWEEPGARIFTVAGGGTAAPADGAPATRVRLRIADVAPLPGGDVLILARGRLWRLGATDGRLHAVPAGGLRPTAIATRADGTILALSSTAPGDVFRLSPMERIARLDVARSPRGLAALATLADGGTAVSDGARTWRIAPDGAVGPAYRSGQRPRVTGALAGLPGGGFAAFDGGRAAVVTVDPAGAATRLRARRLYGVVDLAGLDGGAVLVAQLATGLPSYRRLLPVRGTLSRLAGDRRTVLGGADPGLGPGDGDPLATATVDPRAVAPTTDGALAIAERRRLRLVAGPHSTRPLLAITRPTYDAFPAGVRTTATGPVTVTVTTRRGRVVATASGTGPEVALPAALPPGVYRIAAEAGEQTARLTVDTRRRISRRAARRLARRYVRAQDGGDDAAAYGERLGRCRRVSPRRVDCRRIAYELRFRPRQERRRCAGRASVRQRPDGRRLVLSRRC